MKLDVFQTFIIGCGGAVGRYIKLETDGVTGKGRYIAVVETWANVATSIHGTCHVSLNCRVGPHQSLNPYTI